MNEAAASHQQRSLQGSGSTVVFIRLSSLLDTCLISQSRAWIQGDLKKSTWSSTTLRWGPPPTQNKVFDIVQTVTDLDPCHSSQYDKTFKNNIRASIVSSAYSLFSGKRWGSQQEKAWKWADSIEGKYLGLICTSRLLRPDSVGSNHESFKQNCDLFGYEKLIHNLLFQLFQDIIKWGSAVTCACHKGKMYVRRKREWRVTDCEKDLDFAAVTQISTQLFILFSGCFWGVSGVFWKGYPEEIQLLSLPLQGGNQFCRRSRPTCDLVWVRWSFQFTPFHQPQCFLSGIPRLEKSWHFSLERKCAWGTFWQNWGKRSPQQTVEEKKHNMQLLKIYFFLSVYFDLEIINHFVFRIQARWPDQFWWRPKTCSTVWHRNSFW